jgi:hypothetical protein
MIFMGKELKNTQVHIVYSLVLVCKIHVRVDMKQILIGYLSLSICSIWEMLAWMTLELSKSFCGKSSEFPLLLVVIIVYISP